MDATQMAPEGRLVGGTELSWCKAVLGGTGITVLALLLSRPIDHSILETSLHRLQNSHPILRAKLTLHSNLTTTPFYSISPTPQLRIKSLDASTTAEILRRDTGKDRIGISPFHSLLEHELNQNPWFQTDASSISPTDVFFATAYALPGSESSFVALRFHTSVCDRTCGVSILRQLLDLIGETEEATECADADGSDGRGDVAAITAGIEELIPSEHLGKPFWAKGRDLIGYSLNFKRSGNLMFEDAGSPRSSEVTRLVLSNEETRRLFTACKAKEIKLCGALAAAGLLAAVSSNHSKNRSETYSVVTLVDCRRYLDPPLDDHNLGFYHSAIQNAHTVHRGEDLWEVSRRCYKALSNSMSYWKHLRDIGDLNYLMCKAIDNPNLTPSSSMRTALISVFEDPVVSDDGAERVDVGDVVEDYMGCASVHGVGPSVAVFDTVRDGRLDCACVYPSPLHSRKQMKAFVDDMKRILIRGCTTDADRDDLDHYSGL